MKIALSSLYLPSGSKIGSGYQAHAMANALCRAGHQVTVFSPCTKPDDAIYQHHLVVMHGRMRTFRFALELSRLDLSSFDVFHAHGDDYWMWSRRKPPHVRTMHGSCFAEAAHVPRLSQKLRMFMLGLSEVLATAVADRTVCVSRNTVRYYPWVRRVIPNGVDLHSFHPGESRESDPTILFVGTYQNRKRGKLLMDQFTAVIRPAVPAAKLWMVCGDAPPADGVVVHGRLDEADLADLYRRAWVFCLPSSYEGFGVPYIEAMASGTPVVATPNVGAVEVLDSGNYGVLSEPGRLGQTILELLRDKPRRDQLSQAGLERARDYSWERIVHDYESIYAGIMDRPRLEAQPQK